MTTKIIDRYNHKFLQIELIPISQKNKQFFIAKLLASQLLKIFTVEPARYDINRLAELAKEYDDDENYYRYITKENKKSIGKKAYQRIEDKDRVKSVSKFINNEEFALLPNTIILTCALLNNLISINDNTPFLKLNKRDIETQINNRLSYLEIINEKYTLYVPFDKNMMLVIDGQHRIRGIQESKPDIIKDYELLISLIIGYDRSIVAKLFYTINYTQKSVNKSLLYHLMTEFSNEIDKMSFLHGAVKIFNELEKSPFYKRIKMLGTTPKNIQTEEKKKMTISQAFLIDYLISTISNEAKQSIHQPILLYYYNNDLHIEIIRFLINYFSAVKTRLKTEWEDPENNILTKTVGIGALIRLLPFFYIKMFFSDFNSNPEKMINLSTNELSEKLEGIENIDFTRNGEFGGVGSAGSLNKLKKEMIEKITYFENDNYDNFLITYKQNDFIKYKEWLSKNI